ncbi:hypothetical protein, partial [Sinomonas sp. G460-2]|uniref:hypothetical protein n=1 Tax=Sinomonas sp. G460-2 TaxID=3393464 RepID=UPI0039EFE27B
LVRGTCGRRVAMDFVSSGRKAAAAMVSFNHSRRGWEYFKGHFPWVATFERMGTAYALKRGNAERPA